MLTRGRYDVVLLLCLFEFNVLGTVRGQEGSGTTMSTFEDCAEYPTLANANAFTGTRFHGDTLDVICNDGFINIGAEVYVCYDGDWLVQGTLGEPICARQCTIPTIANGQANLTNGCRHENCMINFQCDAGYTINGQQQLTCQTSGTWGTLPTCDVVDCGAPSLTNGSYSGSTTHGSEVTFECNNKYRLAGSSTANCGADGTWSELPTCLYNCGILGTIRNATFNNDCAGEQLEGCFVNVTCSDGYRLVGNRNVQCVRMRGWTNAPACVKIGGNQNSQAASITLQNQPQYGQSGFNNAVYNSLVDYYRRTMGPDNFEDVVLDTIVPNGDQIEVNYTVITPNTEAAKGKFSKAQSDLVTSENLEINGQPDKVLKTTLLGVTLQRDESRETEVLREAACQLYDAATEGGCPDGTECQITLEGNTTTFCEPITRDDDYALQVGLGVGIPLFLLACALLGVCCCYCCMVGCWRRRRPIRVIIREEEETNSTMSGFTTRMPTRLYTGGYVMYGSYYPSPWDDASSVDSDENSEVHRPTTFSHFVPAKNPEQSQIASNFSWDFMYPHMDKDVSVPRPRVN